MNKQNVTISMMAATALLLTFAIIFVGQTDKAVAGNAQSTAAGYSMVPIQVTSTREVMVVVDSKNQRLNAYSISDAGTVEYAPQLTIALDQYFGSIRQGPAAAPQAR